LNTQDSEARLLVMKGHALNHAFQAFSHTRILDVQDVAAY
jgi:hypothetical protein